MNIFLQILLLLTFSCLCQFTKASESSNPPGLRHRLIILADMGNERDEEQQMVHLLMYCNEFDLEGLIAVSGIFLNSNYRAANPYKSILHPELFDTLVAGYSKVYDNLTKHAANWPTPDYLKSIISTGQKDYGMADTGPGKSSPGSELIIKAVTTDDPRPVHVVVNAGSNTLAQAIIDFERSHTKTETESFVQKLVVYENGSQDDAGAWIVSKYPKIHWIRSNYQTYAYAGPGEKISNDAGPYTWQSYPYNNEGQKEWARENIQAGHGELGSMYPDRILKNKYEFLEGGGTAPWLGLISRGLSDLSHPGWGGWSGRFTAVKKDTVWSRHKTIAEKERTYEKFSLFADTADKWVDPLSKKNYNDIFAPLMRWRKHQFDDFKARVDWCVQPFELANHNPVAVINGSRGKSIQFIQAKAGQKIKFDASASYDPDKNQRVSFFWWIYPEAGTYKGNCDLNNHERPAITFDVPKDAAGNQIHLILDVSDNSPIAVMHDYRRIVIEVSSAKIPSNNSATGHTAGEGQESYIEENSMLIVEMESAKEFKGWSAGEIQDNGNNIKYLTWKGEDYFNSPGNALLEYKININNPGIYRFIWHTKVGTGESKTEHNDTWLRIPDASDFYGVKEGKIIHPKGVCTGDCPKGAGSDGWFKIYSSGTTDWTWSTRTSDKDAHQIFTRFEKSGIYTVQISARSTGHFLNRFVIYRESEYSEKEATVLSLKESGKSRIDKENKELPKTNLL